MRCRMIVSWPTTTVWPALFPPWKRTTASAKFGQKVDDFAFAFIPPLHPDHDYTGHRNPSSRARNPPCPPLLKGGWGDFRDGLTNQNILPNFNTFTRLSYIPTHHVLLEQSLFLDSYVYESENFLLGVSSFPRRPESRKKARKWIPAPHLRGDKLRRNDRKGFPKFEISLVGR